MAAGLNWYKADLRELSFVLLEQFRLRELLGKAPYEAWGEEEAKAILDATYRFAREVLGPLNAAGDREGCRIEDGQVRTPKGFKEAWRQLYESGFKTLGVSTEHGGQDAPKALTVLVEEILSGANPAFNMYPGLAFGAAETIIECGTPEQAKRYAEQMVNGTWGGTMCLTEPHAGSDVGAAKTSARKLKNGKYAIKGTKVFISGGDHDLAENIVHLVLARIRGAPPGVKGISLFIVPKYLVNDDGTLGARNDVATAGLIHKMGYRGTTSTVLNFGEQGRCIGELVGLPHQGLACMFHMMNEARIGVGLGAVMLGYSGYLHALAYARERQQGRSPADKDPLKPQLRIVEHADVRRMLLAQKAYVEGGLALCLYAARLVDDLYTSDSERGRREAALLLDILTPIVKSWPSQYCLEANSLAIQVHGGYGYTREYPVEQLYRDNRLNAIHEGTHGIQALDLLGRKVGMRDGAALQLLMREIDRTVRAARGCESPELRRHAEDLAGAVDGLMQTTRNLLCAGDKGETDFALANAALYLEMAGHIVVGWIWLRQALAAVVRLPGAQGIDGDFYQGKLQACAYFFRWELPKTRHQNELLNSMDRTCYEMQPSWF